MLTYNKVIQLSREFQQAHHMLNHFGNGADFNTVLENTEGGIHYPIMWMEDLPMPLQDGVEVMSFRVGFLALVEQLENRGSALISTNRNEVISDMMLCAKDFVAYWVQDHTYSDFRIQKAAPRQTVEGVTPDNLWGCYVDITFSQAFRYDKCAIPMTGVTPPPDPCADATYKNSDSTFVQAIASGDIYTAPDVTITVDGTPYVIPANKDAVLGGSPAINVANLAITGQTTSNRPGDDGGEQQGRGVNWFTLDYTNRWGHTGRLCGTTGGYTDGTNYFDVNGDLSDKATEFADGLMQDWFYYDQVNDTVPMWYIHPFGTNTPTAPQTGTIGGKNWNSANDEPQASTQGGYNNWFLPNKDQLDSLLWEEQNVNSNQGMNYPPLDYNFSGFPTQSNWRIWTSTNSVNRAQYYINDNGSFSNTSKTTASYTYFMRRIANVTTDLGI